jgi:flagella basal body P-ring formation protein FlgA
VALERSVVRLSDIFSGLEAGEDAEIALAPAPGQSVTYNATVLKPLAARYGLAWNPDSYTQKITLKRAAVYVTADMVRDLVAKKIDLAKEKGVSKQVKFDGRAPGLVLAAGDDLDYHLDAFEYDQDTRRFRGKLVAQTDNGNKTQFIAGHIAVTCRVPVLARRVQGGEILARSDLVMEEIEEMRVQPGVLTNLSDIVGKELNQPQGAGSQLFAHDLGVPRMVKRGEIVTLKIETPYMKITVQGKALQYGVYGESIRVSNTSSKRIVEGVVTEAGVVCVGTEPQQVAFVK